MFETISALPPDPILGLGQKFVADTTPDKINLSVGVYQDDNGNTPVFDAVKQAEQQLLVAQTSKAYIPQQGDPAFVQNITRLTLGASLADQLGDRVQTVMTPGGCGALRMLAELLVQAKPDCTVWVSDPTWGNHFPLLQSAGLRLETYSYYDGVTGSVNFSAMIDSLAQIPKGDVVLLHACCHNPTGADMSHEQWDQVIDLMAERQLLPFIDMAYQGFGHSVDEDAYGIRQAVEKLPEVIVATSCSKNFGLYRERTGSAMVITESSQSSIAAKSHIMSAARKCYSMSPYHGGGIVGLLLSDADLTSNWLAELDAVKNRINGLRQQLADGLNNAQSIKNFDFVANSHGMFCYLGIDKEDVLHLRSEYGIYLLDSTRINVAGISSNNIDLLIDRITKTLQR